MALQQFGAYAEVIGIGPGHFWCRPYSRSPRTVHFEQLAQLSQLGIEIGTFDTARAVGFHHKAYLFN